MSFIDSLKRVASNVGYAVHAPGLGISEPAGTSYQQNRSPSNVYGQLAAGIYNPSQQSIIPDKFANVSTTGVNPQTSGQTLGAGTSAAGGGYGGTGGGSATFTPPVSPNTNQEDQANIDILRGTYGQNANDLNAQGGVLDQTYTNSKGDIQNAVDEQQKTADAQKANNEQTFGDILKNQLKTYQDQGRQRTNTYSALGTLDSSSYGEDQLRADQSLAEGKTRTELEKAKANTGIDQQFDSFKKGAMTQLATLATQYQAGKNAIASALANNNLQGAAAINNAIAQIKQRAAEIQNKIIDFSNSVAAVKAQGGTVGANIAGFNGNQYAQDVATQLGTLTQDGNARYAIPTNNAQGSGYIGADGKRYNSYKDYLLAAGTQPA